MKSLQFLLLAAFLLAPSLVRAQAPCQCSPRSATIVRPYFPVEYPDYPRCRNGIGRQQQRGAYAVNSTAGGVPLTVRNMIRMLDCLIPCGPRSGHGCGIACIGAGSGCLGRYCNRDITYCPFCGAPPFSCNCCGNGQARYAPPAWLTHASQFEPCYEEEAPPAEQPTKTKTAPHK